MSGVHIERQAPLLYIVSPCYNEEEALPLTSRRLQEKISSLTAAGIIAEGSRILFVNDGSRDSTWDIIRDLHEEDPVFAGISLSRNRGHQNALLAGLMTSKEYADVSISLDADLQDDIDCIDAMLEKYMKGNDIVYGVRKRRDTDTWFKRSTAEGFYKVLSFLGAEVVFNHADYRLMSRRALQGLAEFPEVNLFLRGMVPLVGYPSDVVYYDRHERLAGESHYPLWKMLSLAMQGVTSLTVRPIRMVMEVGAVFLLISLLILLWSLYRHFTGETISGWTSLMVSVWAVGGMVLFSLGVVGEYVGKIYLETKHRPRYIIQEILI